MVGLIIVVMEDAESGRFLLFAMQRCRTSWQQMTKEEGAKSDFEVTRSRKVFSYQDTSRRTTSFQCVGRREQMSACRSEVMRILVEFYVDVVVTLLTNRDVEYFVYRYPASHL